jgi:hypothetical protein
MEAAKQEPDLVTSIIRDERQLCVRSGEKSRHGTEQNELEYICFCFHWKVKKNLDCLRNKKKHEECKRAKIPDTVTEKSKIPWKLGDNETAA